MLGRTAANLFWLSRYVERAENIARLLEVGYRISLIPGSAEGYREQWDSTLKSAAIDHAFYDKYDEANLANIIAFMLFDKDNPSSVHSCLLTARTNARTVRTAISGDMWESLNTTWLEFAAVDPMTITSNRLPAFLDWIKQRSNEFRGAFLGTALRREGFVFSQLGAHLERADNTARILDVKYYILLPRHEMIGGEVDTLQWAMILRAVSGHKSYRHVYHDRYKAWNVAEFLILRREMPRALIYSYEWINRMFGEFERLYREPSEPQLQARETYDLLSESHMDSIFQEGLHEFLIDIIARNVSLTRSISREYNFY